MRSRLSSLNWWTAAIAGSIIVVLLSIPQFLRIGKMGPDNYPWYVTPDGEVLRGLIIDQTQYLRLVDHFSGRAPDLVVQPFGARALAPRLASLLPGDAASSLFAVNVGFLVLGTFLLAAVARFLTNARRTPEAPHGSAAATREPRPTRLVDDPAEPAIPSSEYNHGATVAAVAVWTISFPVFWYTGKALVDAAAVGMSTLVLWSLYRSHRLLGAVAIVAAVWTKEATVLLVVPAVSYELLRSDRKLNTRLFGGASWIAAAVVAYMSRGALGGGLEITFASWFPPSFGSARGFLLNNLSNIGGIGQFVLTAAPAVLALGLWAPELKREGFTSNNADVWSLALGCTSALALGLWSLWSALFDGRTAWLAVPQAALLVTLAVDRQEQPFASLRKRVTIPRVAVSATLGVVVWVVALVIVNLGVSVPTMHNPGPPRFATAPQDRRPPVWDHVAGNGDSLLPKVPGSPYLVRYRSSAPAQIDGPDGLQPSTPGNDGVVMVDDNSAEGAQASIITDGEWTADLLDVGATMPWEGLSPVSGNGPAVLYLAGGLRHPVQVRGSFADDASQLMAVGSCTLNDCTNLAGGRSVLPTGTEAVVVDATGSWELVPEPFTGNPDPSGTG